ncbi:MAG: lytic transglycosylase domain-containing protein [Deltaproteobacteria bacterium]|nr:lytic transglycosylase domain-containing protein [Deltaproteobacteria bacterium]
MDEEPLKNPLFINKYRWLFIGAGILCMFSFLPNDIENTGSRAFKASLVSHAKIPTPPSSFKPRLPASVIKAERRFSPIIFQAAGRHQVDVSLIKAVIMAESRYNPQAVSKMGAKGLMQLMPGTAKALGVEDAFNPEHNVNGGVKYLKQLLNRFDGDVTLALAAYNAGSRHVRNYKGVPPFKATRYYIKKVFKYYLYYKENLAREVNQA